MLACLLAGGWVACFLITKYEPFNVLDWLFN